MSSEEDDENGLSLELSPRPRQKTFLGKLAIRPKGRRKSLDPGCLHSEHQPNHSSILATTKKSESQSRRVTRSLSNVDVHGSKVEWANALLER